MIVKDVKIEGFKSYGTGLENLELDRINVLIGANGAGKSNFISFIELLSAIATDRLGKYVAENGYADALMHFGIKNTENINVCVTLADDNEELIYECSLQHGVNGELFVSREAVGIAGNGDKEEKKWIYSIFGKSSILLNDTDDDSIAIRRRISGFLAACRVYHFNDTSITSKIRQPGSVWDHKYLRTDAGNLAAYLYHMKWEESLKPYYNRIVSFIREVFPRFHDFDLELPYEGTDVKLSLTWYEKDCDEVFGPNAFSDGTLRFIALTTLLLQPAKYLPKVIVLDEPEIGLHPNAVSILATMIRMASEYAQIIIATQSVELLNEFEPEDIIIADYDDKKRTSILKRPKYSELEAWLEDYTLGDLWLKNVLGATP